MRARVLFAVGLVGVALTCLGLGRWQVGRMHEKQAWIDQMEVRLAAPSLPLAEALADPDAHAFRRVRARGRLQVEHNVLLDGRKRDRRIGNHLVTPLAVAEMEPWLLVDRGFITRSDAEAFARDEAEPGGPVEIEGVLLRLPELELHGEAPARDRLHWVRLHRAALERQIGVALAPLLLVRADDGSGQPPEGRTPRPESRVDHWNYALTWFSVAAIATVLAGIVLLRRPDGSGPLPPTRQAL